MCSLFIYKVRGTPTDSTKDVALEWKLPVDEFLTFNIGTLSMLFWHVFCSTCNFDVSLQRAAMLALQALY